MASGDPLGHGLLLALTPVIAQLNGSGRVSALRIRCDRASGWQVLFPSHYAGAVECRLHYPLHGKHRPALADKAVGYLRALLWGAPGICSSRLPVTNVKVWQKPSRDGNGLYRPAGEHSGELYLYLGHFGMPELGGVGCGVATAAVIGSCSLPWFLTLNAPAPCANS